MTPLRFILMGVLTAATAAAQTPLVCPPPPAGRTCDAYHFHVQMYRPDTKQFTEVTGTNAFATQAACDRARDAQVAANGKVVEFFRANKQPQYEADRFGPCHCDMTGDRTSPAFLTDEQRTMQLRTVAETRLRVRERLLDRDLPSDSEIVRAVMSEVAPSQSVAAPKFVPLPQTNAAPVLTSVEELHQTRPPDNAKPIAAALDLPLADLEGAEPAAATAAAPGATTTTTATTTTATTTAPATTAATTTTTPAATAPAAEPVQTVDVAVEQAPAPPPANADIPETRPAAETEADAQSAQEVAEKFISYETERIQNVLKAANAIGDEGIKSSIFEACLQRINLLSNLRLLIEGSGMRSRLAVAARDAESESARLALIGRLFGDDIKPHWAPRDASEVVVPADPAVAAAPERALRDTTGTFSTQQKKRALYLVLAQTQPGDDQRLWLSSLIEELLR